MAKVVERRLPGLLVHDFRRTAIRRLERAGVARSVAMKLVGEPGPPAAKTQLAQIGRDSCWSSITPTK